MNAALKSTALALATALLAACGGGSEGPGSAPPQPAPRVGAEGVWQGTLSDGRHFSSLVLENGQAVTLYGPMVNGVFAIAGMLQGTINASGSALTSADMLDFASFRGPAPAALQATYTPGASIQGTFTEHGLTTGFAGTSGDKDISLYDYDAPAQQSTLSGAWALNSLDGSSIEVTITGGSVQGSSSGCAFQGTVQPRASGRNVFDVSLTFGGAPCVLPGATVLGNALTSTLKNGQHQLIVAGTTADRATAVVALGIR